MIDGLLRPRSLRRVHDQVNDLDIAQHPQDLVVQGQLLLPAQTLHAIEHQVYVVAQTLRLLRPVCAALTGPLLPYKASPGPLNGGVGWFNSDGRIV